MKVSEAKTKVCPFMSRGQIIQSIEDGYTVSSYNDINYVNCICSDCMAWETITSRKILEEVANCKCGYYYMTNAYDNCPKCGNNASIIKEVEILEGYCKRLEK